MRTTNRYYKRVGTFSTPLIQGGLAHESQILSEKRHTLKIVYIKTLWTEFCWTSVWSRIDDSASKIICSVQSWHPSSFYTWNSMEGRTFVRRSFLGLLMFNRRTLSSLSHPFVHWRQHCWQSHNFFSLPPSLGKAEFAVQASVKWPTRSHAVVVTKPVPARGARHWTCCGRNTWNILKDS